MRNSGKPMRCLFRIVMKTRMQLITSISAMPEGSKTGTVENPSSALFATETITNL